MSTLLLDEVQPELSANIPAEVRDAVRSFQVEEIDDVQDISSASAGCRRHLVGAAAQPHSRLSAQHIVGLPRYAPVGAEAPNLEREPSLGGAGSTAPFRAALWANFLAFCSRPAFQRALEDAKTSKPMAPTMTTQKRLKIEKWKFKSVPSSGARDFDPALSTFALLINSTSDAPCALRVLAVEGGEQAKSGMSFRPYRLILQRSGGKAPEPRVVEVFGSTLAALCPEEALNLGENGRVFLDPARARKNLDALTDTLLITVGISKDKCALRGLVRPELAPDDHVFVTHPRIQGLFNDALAGLDVDRNVDASASLQLQSGAIVVALGTNLRFDSEVALALPRAELQQTLGPDAADRLASASLAASDPLIVAQAAVVLENLKLDEVTDTTRDAEETIER